MRKLSEPASESCVSLEPEDAAAGETQRSAGVNGRRSRMLDLRDISR